jgi:predicted transglutaminase-like cysteine proteinase
MWVGKRKRLARVLCAALAWSVAACRPEAAAAALAETEAGGFAEPFAFPESPPSFTEYASRWQAITRAIETDARILARCRIEPGTCPDAAHNLLRIVETAQAKEGLARVGEVNRAINLAIRYESDTSHHGAPDVWASPLATLSSGRGDCEDYALAKYLALREAGVPVDDIRFVIVRDTKLEENHAVVTVRFGDRWLVLDNRRLLLLTDREAPNYAVVSVFGPAGPTLSAETPTGGTSQPEAPATSSAGDEEDAASIQE